MRPNTRQGFSLIEVMVTIAILLGLVIGVSYMLRSSISVKTSLSREARITHRLTTAMSRVAWDVEHAFLVGLNDTSRGGSERQYKTIFKVDKDGDNDRLVLTTTGNIMGASAEPQSDTAFVVYALQDAKDMPGRKHLYRGSMPPVVKDIKDEPTLKLFVRNVKSFKIIPWNGDGWSNDRWDSTRSDTRDKLPRLVRVEIETWNDDDDFPTDGSAEATVQANSTVTVATAVFIQQGRAMKDLKQTSNSVRIY